MSERILIVRLSAMGDLVQSTPVARGLKAARPDCHLAWLAQAPFARLLEHNPHIDELIVVPRPIRLSDFFTAAARLRSADFDIAIDLQGLMKSAIGTWLSAAPRRIGKQEAREGASLVYTELSPERLDQQYISQRYLELCAPLGVSRDDFVPELFLVDEDFARVDQLFAEEGLGDGSPVIALVTFSAKPRREWPEERVLALAEMLIDRFDARIVLPGSAAERERAEALSARLSRPAVVTAGRTSVREAAALMQRVDLVVGIETGLTHIAYAVGTPVVCILTYTPVRNGPVGPLARTVYVDDLDCRPCRPNAPCAHRRCVTDLTPELVFAAVEDLAPAAGLA